MFVLRAIVINQIFFLTQLVVTSRTCRKSLSEVHGTKSKICSGDLLFEDNFDFFDPTKWRLQNTVANNFQWFSSDPKNSYVLDGNLHLKLTMTADEFGEEFLSNGRAKISRKICTATYNNGCDKQATPDNIINPIRSAGVDTWNSFSFKFGTVDIRAKSPSGDWIWPVLWLKPRFQKYGTWPLSGEIDIMESRANRELFAGKTPVGNRRVASTVHFGLTRENKMQIPSFKTSRSVFSQDFHNYKVTWSPNGFDFYVDDELIGTVAVNEGFWKKGNFSSSENSNPWINGTLMAPFDEKFYIVMDLAVGGTTYFVDSFRNGNGRKPWRNSSPRAAADFWEGRDQWKPTWRLDESEDSHFQIDYVRVWAL